MVLYLTQCPSCKTNFRTSPAQLDAAQGSVRCGACLSIFSAQSNRTALEMAKVITNCEDELAVNYGTEAGLFAQSGFSSVICGPGSIEQAHQPNEFVELQQLSLCEKFIHQVVNKCS